MTVVQKATSLEPALARMLTQTLGVQPANGVNEYGEPQYGPLEEWPCLQFALPDRAVTKDGVIAIDWCMVITPPNAPVTAQTLITLPDGSVLPVLGVETVFDERGPHHLEIYAGHQPTVFGLFS